MSIAVLGAGAFGTSLAMALAQDGQSVLLWGRDPQIMTKMDETRETGPRLPGYALPDGLTVTANLSAVTAETCLIAVPMQRLSGFLSEIPETAQMLIACCKGVDQTTALGPVATIKAGSPHVGAAMLTGPSFAKDIAAGLPTALVLACDNDPDSQAAQSVLSRTALRIYRTNDVVGAELGGALKNVVALAAGMTIGAGLGDSARASVIARGFAEMSRYAIAKGAQMETLQGLSGLGDLVLTCTSDKSRNFTAGLAFGQGKVPGEMTIEGMATADAVARDAAALGLELPLTSTVARVTQGYLDIPSAIATLLARPAGKE